MRSDVERFAARSGWQLARCNLIVEGTSDVGYFSRSSELHADLHGSPLLDRDLAVLASGQADDGGVDGVNRRLTFFRELADGERDATGRLRFRFAGLFDADTAGRFAFRLASQFDHRVIPYVDVFLLHPVLPEIGPAHDRTLAMHSANLPYSGLDWEIEDLCSSRIWTRFQASFPGAIISTKEAGGLVHREIDPARKPDLLEIFRTHATLEDAAGIVALVRALRAYLGLEHAFIGGS